MNALLTEKRILFLGHGQPAGNVASFVLAACSLSGHVLRGFTERAFPYSNLAGLDILEATPGYIAGVINPRFEDLQHTWDILCNIETGRITVSKHLKHSSVSERPFKALSPSLAQDESINAAGFFMGADGRSGAQDVGMKGESHDNQFIEEVILLPTAKGRCTKTAYLRSFVPLRPTAVKLLFERAFPNTFIDSSDWPHDMKKKLLVRRQ